jgi:hypothetical protein
MRMLRTAAVTLAAAALSCVIMTAAHATPPARPAATACAAVPGGTVCEINVRGYAETRLTVRGGTVSGIVVMWQGTEAVSGAAGCWGNSSCTFGRELRLSATTPTCEMFTMTVPGQRTIVYGPLCLYPRR